VTRPLDSERQRYARDLRTLSGLRSEALFRAFASVAREDYLGPGPWRILEGLPIGYRTTDDADPRHLYANVLIAIDEGRQLNNGQPSALAGWLDALDISAGDRALHVGCGVGYYTAIIAEVVGPTGRVTAVELDPQLAARSARNLARYDSVEVVCADGSEYDPGPQDVIFVNAGATDAQPIWLDSLASGGRLLFPMTVSIDDRGMGGGWMLKLTATGRGIVARFVSPLVVYPCIGARDESGDRSLRDAFGRGRESEVRSLRCDPHASDATCWLHRPGYCLSTLPVDSPPAPVH